MKILLATPLYPPQIGGPAKYAFYIGEGLKKRGYRIKTATYENSLKLPSFIRHIFYFFLILPKVIWSDRVIAFDASSVGFPTALACFVLRKKLIIRLGGDFLWESYIERTDDHISLPDFYKKDISLTRKEKIIKKIINFSLFRAKKIVVNSDWFAKILKNSYDIDGNNLICIENFFQKKEYILFDEPKTFLASSRQIKLKNTFFLREVFKTQKGTRLVTEKMEHNTLLEEIKKAYAIVVASYSEVNPNLILEGLAYGKPFIITKYNGLSPVFKNMGIEIDPFDRLSFQKAVDALLDLKYYDSLVQKIKDSGYEHTWEMIVDEFEKVIV